TEVLPRAALYGEGGTDEMLLHESSVEEGDGDRVILDGVSYRVTIPPFDGPAAASLPRLIAPGSPHWVTSLLPFAIVMTGLAWVARRLPRRSERGGPDDGDDVLDDPVIE